MGERHAPLFHLEYSCASLIPVEYSCLAVVFRRATCHDPEGGVGGLRRAYKRSGETAGDVIAFKRLQRRLNFPVFARAFLRSFPSPRPRFNRWVSISDLPPALVFLRFRWRRECLEFRGTRTPVMADSVEFQELGRHCWRIPSSFRNSDAIAGGFRRVSGTRTPVMADSVDRKSVV